MVQHLPFVVFSSVALLMSCGRLNLDGTGSPAPLWSGLALQFDAHYSGARCDSRAQAVLLGVRALPRRTLRKRGKRITIDGRFAKRCLGGERVDEGKFGELALVVSGSCLHARACTAGFEDQDLAAEFAQADAGPCPRCRHNYELLCPMVRARFCIGSRAGSEPSLLQGWARMDTSTCGAPDSYAGPCAAEAYFKEMRSEDKLQFERRYMH